LNSLDPYYSILELTPGATEQEIKRQFKKLAFQYHPDRNPSHSSHEKFILITEAYEILLGKKKPAKQRKNNQNQTTEERRKKAHQRFQEFQRREAKANERYYQSLFIGYKWKTIKVTAVIGSVLSFFILLDILLPKFQEKDTATYYSKDVYGGMTDETVSLVVTEKGNEYWVGRLDAAVYLSYPDLIILRSRIFHEPTALISVRKTQLASYPLPFTFYSFNWFFILISMVPLLVRIYRKKSIYYTFAYQIALVVSPLCIFFYLVFNWHFIHLVTFGIF
jgi:hypothetical protein